MKKEKVANELFIDKWKQFNRTRDLFWDKKQAILQARHKSDIMEKVIRWLEFDSAANMESEFKLDIPFSNKTIEDESALQQAWIEVMDELKADGFNMDYCYGGTTHYHLILKICTDVQAKQNKKMVAKMMSKIKGTVVK
jgi:hypothetical protein